MYAIYGYIVSVLILPKSRKIIHSMIHHYQNNSKFIFFFYLLRFWCGICMGISGLEIIYDKRIQDIKFFQSMILAKFLTVWSLENIFFIIWFYIISLQITLDSLEIFYVPLLYILLSVLWLMTGFTFYDFIYYKSLKYEADEIKIPSKNLNNR